jgi:hypothetical protein
MTEWPILVIIGMFIFLIAGLAYGSAVTAKLPTIHADKTGESDDAA